MPRGLTNFIGVAELLGGLGLLLLAALTGILPWLTPLAATGLALIMILAAGFHAMREEQACSKCISRSLPAGAPDQRRLCIQEI